MFSMARITMSFSRGGELLSKRLRTLHNFYSHETHVWDIGCDHGLLGLSFLDVPSIKEVHLVDPSLKVIQELKKKVGDSYTTKGSLFIHHKQGQQLKIHSTSNCFFIAGMGGKEIGEIIQHLLPLVNESSQFVISPHRKILELRNLLLNLPITLKDEMVIEEDGQFYQILRLVTGEGNKVSLYGERLWEGDTGQKYLERQLSHFSVHKDEASRAYVTFLKSHNHLKTSPKVKL